MKPNRNNESTTFTLSSVLAFLFFESNILETCRITKSINQQRISTARSKISARHKKGQRSTITNVMKIIVLNLAKKFLLYHHEANAHKLHNDLLDKTSSLITEPFKISTVHITNKCRYKNRITRQHKFFDRMPIHLYQNGQNHQSSTIINPPQNI